jgi:hypothetical protein
MISSSQRTLPKNVQQTRERERERERERDAPGEFEPANPVSGRPNTHASNCTPPVILVKYTWLKIQFRQQPVINWDGRSRDRIPVGTRFFALVQTGPGAHPASCTMGTGSFPRVKSGRGVTLAPHPLLVPWSWKSRAIPLLSLWAVRPVQRLSACTRGALYPYIYRQLITYGDTINNITWNALIYCSHIWIFL